MSVLGLKLTYAVGNNEGPDVLRELALGFEQGADEVRDFGKHVFPRLVPAFEAAMGRQFNSRGTGQTGAWAPLSDTYATWKRKHYPGKPLLELSGALRSALTESGSPNSYREWTASEFSFGTAGLEYASFHQFGTRRGFFARASAFLGLSSGGMPARPPFDFDGRFNSEVEEAALDGVRAAIRSTRLGDLGVEVEGGPH